jgi:hemerythrin-like domain-containing protein
MDVLKIIKSEHREVGALLDEAAECEPHDERLREIAQQIVDKLSLHLAIEERLFYNELRDRSEDEQTVDVFEAYTEHAVAKALMEMLNSGRQPDEKFKAEMQVLGESVKHHVEEEESKVFDIARELIDEEELEQIGEAWERSKQRALSRSASGSAAKKRSRAKVTRGTTGSTRKKKTSKR